jgi:phosphatidylinositol-4,5-bisphosphate 3-kinase
MYHQWLTTQNNMLAFSTLPRETRLCMMVYGVTLERKELLLGYVNQQLFDARGFMLSGVNSLKMWALPEGKPSDTELSFLSQGTTWENMAAPVDKCCMLTFEIDSFEYPVVCPLHPPPVVINEMQVGAKVAANMIPKATMTHLESIVGSDPLREMNDEDKALLWVHRHHFVQRPTALAKFLQTVDWCDKQKQAEAHRLLQTWAPLNPYEAFELLDSRYPDTTVREYSVQCLSGISDSELAELLLQFVQVLKYEPYHDSALTRFLIQRCLKNPYQLGHYFFWHLKAEMHNHDFCERHGLIMEEYLMHAGHHAVELQVQNKIVNSMLEIADHIVHCRTVLKMEKPACMEELRTSMEALNQELPSQFQVSLNPRWVAKKLRPEKCRYMSSKKVPLWLVFENADPDGSDFVAMFKSGDDLRQDILTLQLMRMMDRVWLSEGLDLRLKPYSVIATGVNELNEGAGMLEMVLNSTTISDVQVTYGGGAMGALRNDPLDLYIHAKNPDPKQYEDAVDNFCRSCAGYCVATYVLGIGDRHNGNIMMTQSGHLFHIDFGHFLGNFKSKFGFKRERSPFVFTPEMAYVMGGDDYAKHKLYLSFVDMCCAANNVLRKNASLWIALFVLMQTAGMPELMSHEDVYYLRDMLTLGVSESEASAKFKIEIQNSVSDNYRRIDNAIHNAIHG